MKTGAFLLKLRPGSHRWFHHCAGAADKARYAHFLLQAVEKAGFKIQAA
jgi:hypothetical protein